MDFCFSPLFSGSSGNSLYISAGGVSVLIDAGGTGAQIETALNAVEVKSSDLDAILITHEHSDHIKGAGVFSRRHDIPIYANHATWKAMKNKIGSVSEKNKREFNQSFYLKDLLVEPYSIPHDAVDPVCFSLSYNGIKLSTVSDLGHYTKKLLSKLENSNVVLLESNHDIEMLRQGSYPMYLKRRILGTKGHLSNDMAAKAAYELVTLGVRGIMLSHLSEENNSESIAYKTVSEYLEKKGIEVNRHIALSVLKKECDAFMYRIGGNDIG